MEKNEINSATDWKTLIIILLVVIFTAYFSYHYSKAIEGYLENHPFWGIFIYILMGIIDVLIAPAISLAFVPLAARIWGPFWGALFTLVGWLAGSVCAFLLAQKYGRWVLNHLISIENIEKIKNYIPQNLFTGIILIRLAFPADALSYALGLFGNIRLDTYIAATAIGLAPSAFFLSYIGKLPIFFQVISFAGGATALIWFAYRIRKKLYKKQSN